jgi:succinate-acetate transporter protein
MGWYLMAWGVFTAVMFVGTIYISRALQVVFGSLALLFFLLAIGDFTNAGPGFRQATGYEGIFCGLSAIYTGLAQVLNELAGRTVWPIGPMAKPLARQPPV